MAHYTPEPERERRDVIITDSGGPTMGGIIAAIVGVLAVMFVAWLLFFSGDAGDGAGEPVIPDDVNVDVNAPEGGGG